MKTLNPAMSPSNARSFFDASQAGSSEATAEELLVVDLGSPSAVSVAALLSRSHSASVRIVSCWSGVKHESTADSGLKFSDSVPCPGSDADQMRQAVVFTPVPFCSPDHPELVKTVQQLQQLSLKHVCFVTGCSVYFDSAARELESSLTALFADTETQVTFIRSSVITTDDAFPGQWSRRLSWLYPLLSQFPQCGFVTPAELATCLRDQLSGCVAVRPLAMLGQNQSWQNLLRQHVSKRLVWRVLAMVATILKYVGCGVLFRQMLRLLLLILPKYRVYSFDTVEPQCEEDLLSLCHRHNFRHVVVCGYNNGVKHFGWVHEGKTVVRTTQSGCQIEVDDDHVLVDAGVTLRRTLDVLDAADKQLFVVPNYSYIGMGTIFFVPVHGSGSDVSTLGDTVQWVRLFDPETGQFLEATRGELLFSELMYNRNCGLVLLQMILKVRDATDYFVRNSELIHPTASEIWSVFDDAETSNIEVRKNRASGDAVQIAKYYTSDSAIQDRMSIPRDRIGQLWDRLEENRITAFLFHFLVRRLAYHVELFLREDEFEIFWNHHSQLPVSKIQLRFVKHDGMPHSPFGDADCISADLFMSRRRSREFQDFVRKYLPDVRLNPGKQSM